MQVAKSVLICSIVMTGFGAWAQSPQIRLAKPAPVGANPAKPVKAGGIEVLSDTQGVDFKDYLAELQRITRESWIPILPEEVNPPTLRKGEVLIRFKILPDGRLVEGGMMLEGRSGDSALDRAAWTAITDSLYPPLPEDFKGPFLEIRFLFRYNPDKETDKLKESGEPAPETERDEHPNP